MSLNKSNAFILFTLLTVYGLFMPNAVFGSALRCSDLIELSTAATINVPRFNVVKSKNYMAYDRYPYFKYDDFKKILFLSDGGKAGSVLRQKSTDSQLVVSSDFSFSPGVDIRIDNNKLPFRENAFDLIVMNRGLCPCHSSIACAGIDTKRGPMKKFLNDVVHILNKNDSKSLALLTGFYFPDLFRTTLPVLWMNIITELQAEYPSLQFALLQKDSNSTNVITGFVGIAISTDQATPIAQRLYQLEPSLIDTDVTSL